MAFTLTRDDGLVLSDDAIRLDIDRICAWLAESYWAVGRDRATIERSIAHSYPYGVYAPGGEQVALARATTDLATFAWIGDVIVDGAWRGKGIGTWMMRCIIDHLSGVGVARFLLATDDAHGVYERVGFGPLHQPENWLRLDVRNDRLSPT